MQNKKVVQGTPPQAAAATAAAAAADAIPEFCRDIRGGVCSIAIHAKPGAKRESIAGFYGNSLKVAVKAPPVDGKANKAICSFFADLLGIPQAAVTVVRGDTGRDKVLETSALSAGDVKKIILKAITEK
jgi:uncharacterized protein (TIGR00251 family)